MNATFLHAFIVSYTKRNINNFCNFVFKGQYIPKNDGQYVHVSDHRELGKYVHIPFPYDGGYGPYSGQNIPYEEDRAGEYRYLN